LKRPRHRRTLAIRASAAAGSAQNKSTNRPTPLPTSSTFADGRRINLPSQNILVRNCRMREGHGGVVVGSQISGGDSRRAVPAVRPRKPRPISRPSTSGNEHSRSAAREDAQTP
jgi:hypothetical protein